MASPVFVLAVAVLLLNDHVLKAAWPGLVTGKLSDVAGVVMVAVGLMAATRSRRAAFGATAVTFALLKTQPVVAVWAEPVLGGATRTDPWDLLALVALVPLWPWVSRRRARPATSPRPELLLPLQIVVVSCAVFATTATSCQSDAVDALAYSDGSVFVASDSAVYRSDDFGRTWVESDVSPWDGSLGTVRFGRGTPCPSGVSCVAIARSDASPTGSIVVEQVLGDERAAILTLTSDQQDRIDQLAPPICGGALVSDAIAFDAPDGGHVVLAMGEAGVLHRLPSGDWEWAAVGPYGFADDEVDDEPLGIAVRSTVDLSFWDRHGWIGALTLLVVPAALAACVIPINRLGRRRGRDPVVAIVLCVVAAVLIAGTATVVIAVTNGFDNPSGRYPAAAVLAGLAATIAAALLLGQLRPAERPSPFADAPDPDQRVG